MRVKAYFPLSSMQFGHLCCLVSGRLDFSLSLFAREPLAGEVEPDARLLFLAHQRDGHVNFSQLRLSIVLKKLQGSLQSMLKCGGVSAIIPFPNCQIS